MTTIRTKVVHSETKDAWNVVGTEWGKKYKIARVPYSVVSMHPNVTEKHRREAEGHAIFISGCFNKEASRHSPSPRKELEYVIGIAMDNYHSNNERCRSHYTDVDSCVADAVERFLVSKGVQL